MSPFNLEKKKEVPRDLYQNCREKFRLIFAESSHAPGFRIYKARRIDEGFHRVEIVINDELFFRREEFSG